MENCKGVAPATYGFRGSLLPEEKASRADTTEACRHSCHNVFLYYCDNRARIRKTPGNILGPQCPENEPLSLYMKNCTITPERDLRTRSF